MLTDSAMLVRLNISQWTGEKYDQNVSREVESTKKAQPAVGRYMKQLIRSEHLDLFLANRRKARGVHFSLTLPWQDEGVRILPVMMFDDYRDALAPYKDKANGHANDFARDYSEAIKRAKVELGDMFNEEDYPSKDNIRNKFDFRVNFMPIPEAGDFRVDLEKETMKELKADLTNSLEQAQREAMENLWARLYEGLNKMHHQLGPKGKLFSSIFESMTDLCDILPRMNIAKDPKLDKLAADIKLQVASMSVDNLRLDSSHRAQVEHKAKQLMSKMETLMGKAA